MRPIRALRSAVLAGIVLTGLLATGAAARPALAADAPEPVSATSDGTISTHFYELRKRIYPMPGPTPWVTAYRGSQVLALGADSQFTGSPSLGGTATSYPVHLFDTATATAQSLGQIDLAGLVGPQSWIRVLDFQYAPALQRPGQTTARTLLSLATYSAATGCRRSMVVEVDVDPSGAGGTTLGRTWFTLPCIRPFTPTEGTWLVGPALNQAGGRVAVVPRSQWTRPGRPEIHLTVGDFSMLANLGSELPRSTRRLLGTVLRVPARGPVSVVATGIRNPQGLTNARLDGRAALVATTHGPRGGDGLMDVRAGDDYGWPRESYGTVYDYRPSPPHSRPAVEGRLPTATRPAFSWLPSIGPSAVVQVARGGALAQWWGPVRGRMSGDLLVSGMAATTLYRLRWDDGAVRYVEPIDVGLRIRSLTQVAGGAIVAGVDTAGPDAGTIMVLDPVRQWNSAAGTLS